MTKRLIYSCDLCLDELENPEKADYLAIVLGNIEGQKLSKDICRHCVQAIDMARGRTI